MRQEIGKLMHQLQEEAAPGEMYNNIVSKVGFLWARHWLAEHGIAKQYHIISAIEDFIGFAAGVTRALEASDKIVTYSCVWPQYEVTRPRPMREICPIYQAYHQQEPQQPYGLILAVANIGTVARAKASLIHTIHDQGFRRYRQLDVLSMVSHRTAEDRLKEALPPTVAKQLHLHSYSYDMELDRDGFCFPGTGGNPSRMAGFEDKKKREYFLPEVIARDFDIAPPRYG